MNTIQLQLNYHGEDEVVVARDVELTRNEMRALMVWLSRQTISDMPSDNCALAVVKVFHLLREANNRITELEDAASPV